MKNFIPRTKKNVIIKKIRSASPFEDIFGAFESEPSPSLLHSSMRSDAGRYSYIGIRPFLTIRGKGRRVELIAGGSKAVFRSCPFEALNTVLREYKVKSRKGLPFTAGGIGYFSYGLKNVLEKLPRKASDDVKTDDIYFVFYKVLIIADNREPGYVRLCVLPGESDKKKDTRSLINEITEKIKKAGRGVSSPGMGTKKAPAPLPRPNMTKKYYKRCVEKIKEHIRAGDIYQACFTLRFSAPCDTAPWRIYRKLNSINPSPFSAFLKFGKTAVISSSPELFLKFENGIAETRPMKGTRGRGANRQEDKALKKELADNAKEKAELLMITDLERNDLGKIAVPGSVRTSEHRRIETYPSVFQAISVITAKAKKSASITDIIRAAFPGGSISGCPKIRAMEIIDSLEPTARNIYTGSIGYISFHNTMQLNIAIRTVVIKNNTAYFQAGSGIVADSSPEAEYKETLIKARAMIQSLRNSGN